MSSSQDPTKPAAEAATGMRKGLTHYGDAGFSLFLRKAFIKGSGLTDAALERPVIGITDTGSGYNPCHGNMPQLVEAVQRGIMLAGGLPVKFPTISSARASRRRPACTCATSCRWTPRRCCGRSRWTRWC